MNNKLNITFLMSTDGILVVLFKNDGHTKTTLVGRKALNFTADFLDIVTDISLKEMIDHSKYIEINDICPTRIVVNEIAYQLESDEELEFGKSLIENLELMTQIQQ